MAESELYVRIPARGKIWGENSEYRNQVDLYMDRDLDSTRIAYKMAEALLNNTFTYVLLCQANIPWQIEAGELALSETQEKFPQLALAMIAWAFTEVTATNSEKNKAEASLLSVYEYLGNPEISEQDMPFTRDLLEQVAKLSDRIF